ncbi:MAG: hypothetical protein K9M75_07540 [Phycisphaerae bacterium]|nr:hypothetical protein [Phycisphaerae bacterium]
MIRFFCKECGRRVSVSDDCAGRSGKCPDCGSAVAVPAIAAPVEIELNIQAPPIYDDAADTADGEEFKQEVFNDLGLKPIGLANIDAGKRAKPWYTDIFLYPVSTSGIINLVMLTLLPPLFSVIALTLFMIPTLSFFAFFFLMFKIIIRLYFFWYVAECVRYSCMGQTRAPSVYSAAGEDFWDGLNFYFSIFACYLLCFVWAPISLIGNSEFGITYWSLIAVGCLFFPILFLSIVVIDSISAWNPFMLIISMFRLMPQYLIVSAAMFAGVWLAHKVGFWMFSLEGLAHNLMPIIRPLIEAALVYLSFIAAHLLGRFYWRNSHKLDW